MDEDAAVAGVELIGRAGATSFQFGYLDEDATVEEARWYAHAQYRGARIIEENHRGPVEAIEALARTILEGAKCTHCGGLVALSDAGVRIARGDRHMVDGTVMTEAEARELPLCRWTRKGRRWVRGCEGAAPPPRGPSRRERRAAERRDRRRR